MRDKYKSNGLLVIIIGLVVAITGSAGLVLATKTPSASDTESSKPKVSISAPADQQTAFTYLKYQGKAGQTALALLQAEAAVVTKDSSYGPYVESINGVKGEEGKYWAFYVNGAMAQVGANDYTTKSGDRIEWKLE